MPCLPEKIERKRIKRYIDIEGEDMGISSTAIRGNYLEYLPPNKIAKYTKGPPKNAVPFTGYPQQHRTEKNKLILVHDPLGNNPAVLEFKLDDVLHVEEVHSAVTESGEGVPLIKLWIRQGARGVLLEPFEVDDSVYFLEARRKQKEDFANRKAEKTENEGVPSARKNRHLGPNRSGAK